MTLKTALSRGVALGVLLAVVGGASANAADAKKTKKRHHPVPATYGAVAPAPAPMGATAEDVGALRAEIQELKAQMASQAQAQAAIAAEAAQARADAAAAAASADSVAGQVESIPGQINTAIGELPKPKNDKAYYKGISITMGGFAEAASIYRSHDETADISSSYSKIPFANDRASHTAEFRETARQSRYSILAQGDIDPDTHAYFYGEFDFQAAAQTANSNQSNSYNPRIRHLYAQLDHGMWSLLAGRNWSLVTMNSKGITPRNELPPPVVDGQYIPGFAWARQPQLRLTGHMDNWWFAASLENPQTTFGNVAVASGVTLTNTQAPTNGFFNGTNYSLNRYPDLVGKIAYEGVVLGDHSLHAEVLGIMRNYYDRVTIAPTAGTQAATLGLAAGNTNNSSWGGGFGGGVTFAALPKVLDVQASFLTGKGIARYGSAGLSDVTAEPNGKLEGVPEVMFLTGGTWHATPMLDIYAFGGEELAASKVFHPAGLPSTAAFGYGTLFGSNNAACLIEGGSCSAVTKFISQETAGFWHKLYQGSYGRVQWGIQYSYTERKAFADATAVGLAPKGTENMLFTSFRYYPF